MISGADMVWGGALPAAVAAIVLAAVWRTTRNAASAWRTALIVGYVAGHWTLDARDIGASSLVGIGPSEAAAVHWAYDPRNFDFAEALTKSYRPTEARDWLPPLLLLAIAPDALACVGKAGFVLGGILRFGLCLFVPWRLLNGSVYLPARSLPALEFEASGFEMGGFDTGAWTISVAVAWIGGVAVALLLGWQLARRVDQQSGNLVRSTLAVVVALGAAVTAMAAASLVYGQMLGVLSAALAGCGLMAAIVTAGRGPEAAAGPVIIAFGCLVVVAHFYAELQIHHAALLLLAMIVAIGWLPLPVHFSSRWQSVCRSLICLGLLAIPVIPAVLELAATLHETQSNPYVTARQ